MTAVPTAPGRNWGIGLYAPAGFATEPAAIERAIVRLEAAGHRVTVDPTCGTRWQRFSATDDERLAAVMRMAEDPNVELAIAVRAAAARLGTWRLEGVTVYVTLEPCAMCAGALVNARVDRVVWGADDPKAGAVRSLYTLGTDGKLNHTFEAVAGVLGAECGAQLSAFFARIRASRKAP